MTDLARCNPPVPRNDAAGRERLQRGLRTLLDEGGKFADSEPGVVQATELRGWLVRIGHVGRALTDHFEAPARAAVLELLEHDGVAGDGNALTLLRENIAGASLNQLGDEVGLNGNTLRRIEQERASCYPNSAKKLADRFGLRVLELFAHTAGEDHLIVVDAQTLRERLSLTS
jgi:DNA-binding XRE family transcriptional regulator